MIQIIKKIKKIGIRNSLGMILVKIKKRGFVKPLFLSKKKRVAINAVLSKEYDRVVLFDNHFGYYNIMLQRPQHMTRNLCDDQTLVIYNSYYGIDFKNKEHITQLDDMHYVIDLFYYKKVICDTLRDKDVKKYLMVYSTDTVSLSSVIEYQKDAFSIIYEYVDDINPDLIFAKNLDNIIKRHHYLVRENDTFIVTTATKLYNNVIRENAKAKVKLISNGVECENFSVNSKTEDKHYLEWIQEEYIKVGYYGAMANWVDYELLKELVLDKKIQLVLIGVMHDSSLQDSGLLENDNVRYFGKVAYDKLAGYANYFDVCIIPFVINDITESTSPVKLFEYMSLEKPIVTTALPECLKYDVVNVASNKQEFIELIYRAYSMKENEQHKKALRLCADKNSWESKAKQMKAFLIE